jgi:hypothetical protein
MCHELGHTPGLDHIDTNSCMNNSQYAVFNQLVPIKQDFRELERIYQHQDATTTVAGKQKADKDREKKEKDRKKGKHKRKNDKRNTRGEQIPKSDDIARDSVIVETLDDGRKVVSYITWANEPGSSPGAAP